MSLSPMRAVSISILKGKLHGSALVTWWGLPNFMAVCTLSSPLGLRSFLMTMSHAFLGQSIGTLPSISRVQWVRSITGGGAWGASSGGASPGGALPVPGSAPCGPAAAGKSSGSQGWVDQWWAVLGDFSGTFQAGELLFRVHLIQV